MSRDYRKLRVFDLADKLALEIYKITKSYPREEIFGLTSQMRRAAVSVPSNIAEGSARNTLKDYIHFLVQALGSLNELAYYIEFSFKLDYINQLSYKKLASAHHEVAGSLQSLINSLQLKL